MSSESPVLDHLGPSWRVVVHDLRLDEAEVLRCAANPQRPSSASGDAPASAVHALSDAIESEAADPAVALRAGQILARERSDPALFAASCSPDLNTALARLRTYDHYAGQVLLAVDIGVEETRVRVRCRHRPDVPRLLGLTEAVLWVALARRASRHEIVPRLVTAQHLPDDTGPYEAYLGCPIEPAADYTVQFAAPDAKRPFVTHSERMWEALEPYLAQRALESRGATSTRRVVESVLPNMLAEGRPRMRDAAEALGVGERTLQRRLAAEGTTWLEVLNGTRERLARRYLETSGMSAAEISFRLGFQDPNSFFRAFQRWTGTTPEGWRAQVCAATSHDDRDGESGRRTAESRATSSDIARPVARTPGD